MIRPSMGTALNRLRLRRLALIVGLLCVVVPVFNLLTDEVSLSSALQGLVDGFLVASAAGFWILFVHQGWLREWFRRLGFLSNLLVNSTALLVIFLLVRAIGNTVTTLDPARFFGSLRDPHLWIALPFFIVAVVGIQFMLQMSQIIGTNVLRYFVAGVYHRPKREERVFLFLDLVGSTRLAERLGSATYYDLLHRFVDDLTEPVLQTEGEIYQYAGDEVVVTWRMDRALRDANCLRCYFEIASAIERGASRYEKAFGEVPRFRAGVHGGEVVAGELGALKQSIVFVGDILNTAARLEEWAKLHEEGLVVSSSLLERIGPRPGLRVRRLDDFVPRGKEERVSVYAVDGV